MHSGPGQTEDTQQLLLYAAAERPDSGGRHRNCRCLSGKNPHFKTLEISQLRPLFYDFLEALTTGDVIHLEELENRIAKLETAVLSGTLEDFNHKMLPLRKEVMDLTHYYTQLEELGAEMEENETGVLNRDEVRLFHLFGDRMGRLREETQMLREYSMQVREVYQSQIDLRQNKIMKILTVVTTLFLPLTLVAGWYGMNFDMPEFSSPFGLSRCHFTKCCDPLPLCMADEKEKILVIWRAPFSKLFLFLCIFSCCSVRFDMLY